MLSLDGRVIVQGTVRQDGIGFLAVRNHSDPRPYAGRASLRLAALR
jgi:hypothetical protein